MANCILFGQNSRNGHESRVFGVTDLQQPGAETAWFCASLIFPPESCSSLRASESVPPSRLARTRNPRIPRGGTAGGQLRVTSRKTGPKLVTRRNLDSSLRRNDTVALRRNDDTAYRTAACPLRGRLLT